MIFGAPCPSAPPRVRNGRGPGEGCGSARKTGQTGQTGQKDRQLSNRGADDVQNRTAAQDVLQITRVPTRDPTGADFAGVPRKRFWLQRCAFLATGSERVPTGADCASRSDSSSRTGLVTNHAGADAGADGYRLRRRAAETRLAAAPCVSCSGIRAGADGCRLRHPNHSPTSTPPSVRAQRSMLCLRDRDFPISTNISHLSELNQTGAKLG